MSIPPNHFNFRPNSCGVPVGSLVELTKVQAAPDAAAQPGSWTDYPIGTAGANSSLPVDYVLVGLLLERPQVGRSVRILRIQRNGVDALGTFESTPVTEVLANGFVTRNSVYRLRIIKPDSEA